MTFYWVCPCGYENHYKGKKTKDANSTCSKCSKTMRIWSRRKIEPIQQKPTNSNIIQQNKLEIKDVLLGSDLNRSVLIEGLNDTIRIYRNSILDREGKRLSKNKALEGKRVLAWVERYENQLGVPLLVVHHPYFTKVLNAYRELEKLRVD